MSIADVVSRMSQLQALAAQAVTPTVEHPTQQFASTLAATSSDAGSSPYPLVAGASAYPDLLLPTSAAAAGQGSGAQVLAAAEAQVGQAEEPPGSNDGPAL